MRPAHLLSAVQAILGTLLLARPRQVAAAVAGPQPPAPSGLVRALGLRTAGQAVAGLVAGPGRRLPILKTGAAVEAAHAASMLAAARWRPAYRRSALLSAAAAVAFLAADLAAARSAATTIGAAR